MSGEKIRRNEFSSFTSYSDLEFFHIQIQILGTRILGNRFSCSNKKLLVTRALLQGARMLLGALLASLLVIRSNERNNKGHRY